MANFIPTLRMGASRGKYFLPKSHKLPVFEEKRAYKNSSGSQFYKLVGGNKAIIKKKLRQTLSAKFSPFCSASPEIIGVKFGN